MLKDILSIHGESGLFRLLSKSKNMVIVESLKDKKRMPVFSDKHIISLNDIAIYTETEEVPLQKVFSKIKQHYLSEEIKIDPKSPADELRRWFATILPDFDKDRVYPTDIKKVILWYNILVKNGITDFETEKKDEEELESNLI